MQQLKEQKLLFSKTKSALQFPIEYQMVWSEGLRGDKTCHAGDDSDDYQSQTD